MNKIMKMALVATTCLGAPSGLPLIGAAAAYADTDHTGDNGCGAGGEDGQNDNNAGNSDHPCGGGGGDNGGGGGGGSGGNGGGGGTGGAGGAGGEGGTGVGVGVGVGIGTGGNATGGNAAGGDATGGNATGGAGGAGGSGVGTVTTQVDASTKNPKQHRFVAGSYAPTVVGAGGSDSCLGSASGGAQTGLFGISLGGTTRDITCQRIKFSRRAEELGMPDVACRVLAKDSEFAAALSEAGRTCNMNEFAARLTPVPIPTIPVGDAAVPTLGIVPVAPVPTPERGQ